MDSQPEILRLTQPSRPDGQVRYLKPLPSIMRKRAESVAIPASPRRAWVWHPRAFWAIYQAFVARDVAVRFVDEGVDGKDRGNGALVETFELSAEGE
ncbi:hypothetical protein Pan216_46610 [Planctomycetes bacterium Pan216]|uniref:Uncharacterized protein n=1 Tax=Kolteria novifilia TaxID=2527975 RepID=A0A518B9W6_9BACT|nr:hypothetical protein Pan216_46610 [Planctomycetes bacterium Pan216]